MSLEVAESPAPDVPVSTIRAPDTLNAHEACGTASWWLAGASRRGVSHVASNRPREDALLMAASEASTRRWFAIALADGVGSVRFPMEGSNLAVKVAIETIRREMSSEQSAGGAYRDVVGKAAMESRAALVSLASDRHCVPKDFATTLLILLGVQEGIGAPSLVVFQVGNGLIARFSDSELVPLIDPGDEDPDGAIRELTGAQWLDSLASPSRLAEVSLDPTWRGVVLLSDGVSDDIYPYQRGGPVLARGILSSIADDDSAGTNALDLISYEKRGSSDDRTLACALFRQVSPA